ncbi:two-component system activity regulator YycH [Alkalihalobacillus sp. LMS39]|uniref:YycH family regulatory protein n=1 Tax=Alkalihalobacillus sp. LMS39 TaxID=2924032 RepID=UPI001FB4C4A6|nr:two-component system activity regulator YycH [Alkalihalobacillus sp. LMS39]UOE94115.1 two-component system activity regulator YycH [Alkalihalobacillus sp. LMS39]
MTFENVKSATLTLLVLLSLFLTWELWTFQPEYALLKEAEYVENTKISEERSLTDVIAPQQVILHNNEDVASLDLNDVLFEELYEQLVATNVEDLTVVSWDLASPLKNQSIEFVYPTSIPAEVILNMFPNLSEDTALPTESVDRLILYHVTTKDKIHLRMVSYEEQVSFDFATSFSIGDFQNVYLAKATEYIPVFAYEKRNDEYERFTKHIYLPKEETEYPILTYTTTAISVDVFKQILFSDLLSVKKFRQEGGNESYTDGNRMINVSGRGLYMNYINPISSEGHNRSGKHGVLSSIEFINGHGGWTDDYVLANWTSTLVDEEAHFRLRINHIPVMRMGGQDTMLLSVSRTGNQTAGYSRPLFDLDYTPIGDATRAKTLVSGYDVLSQLEDQEAIEVEKIEDIRIGYEMTKNNAYITVSPFWFMKYGGYWQKIKLDEPTNEVDDYGLE